ncbi:MAG: 3-carboxy-cis,cis-muconate cycloisomerase PcaB [Rhodobacteraceae bacterium HLUCCA08]|nr:MAG: 3-carboxy-cis,cis-muconate cycloisomerase PcaB [Rhodobacteraceae bacterium HLUCCA08]
MHPVSNALYAPLFADPEIAALFSTEASLAGFCDYQAALTAALAETGQVNADLARLALAAIDGFRPDPEGLEAVIRRDGVPVPGLLAQLRAQAGDGAVALHRGATSQDVIDTTLALSLRALFDALSGRLRGLIDRLNALVREYGDASLMGRTRMQAALPVTARHRIAQWRAPLSHALDGLAALRGRVERVHYAGPVGLQDAPQAHAVIAHMARALDLSPAPPGSHTDRAWIAETGGWLSLVTGALGKIGQDLALMAQQGLDAVRFEGGGGRSSAMPHKHNPVEAEILVALARFNATALGGLHQALVHEQERSGAAWALEWMLLPQMAECAGAATGHADRILERVRGLGD